VRYSIDALLLKIAKSVCERIVKVGVVGRLTVLCCKFTAQFVLKEFLKSLNIRQIYEEKVDCLKRPVHRGTVLLKDELA